jgi:hypothetical protein
VPHIYPVLADVGLRESARFCSCPCFCVVIPTGARRRRSQQRDPLFALAPVPAFRLSS